MRVEFKRKKIRATPPIPEVLNREDCYWVGGSLVLWLTHGLALPFTPSLDFDVLVTDPDLWSGGAEKLAKLVNGDVIVSDRMSGDDNIYIDYPGGKLDLIPVQPFSSNALLDALTDVAKFDLSILQMCYHQGYLYYVETARRDLRALKFSVIRPTVPNRVKKYLDKGFSLYSGCDNWVEGWADPFGLKLDIEAVKGWDD